MTTAVNPITTHVADAQARVLLQFDDSPRLLALLEILAERLQTLETANAELPSQQSLDNATGEQLDGLGRNLNIDRGGRDDETYRLLLRTEIRINRSRGLVEDIIAAAESVYESAVDVRIEESFPAEVIVEVRANASSLPTDIANTRLQISRPAGVTLYYVWWPDEEDDIFTYAPGSTEIALDNRKGYSDLLEASGGRYAGVYVTEVA